jgi:anti-anti-sigma factor
LVPHLTIERDDIERDGVADTLVVRACGPLDLFAAADLDRALRTACEEAAPHARLVLDASGVPFLSTTGLITLLDTKTRCDHQGIGFTLVTDHRSVLRLLRVTESDDVLHVVSSLPQALAETPAPATPASAWPPPRLKQVLVETPADGEEFRDSQGSSPAPG